MRNSDGSRGHSLEPFIFERDLVMPPKKKASPPEHDATGALTADTEAADAVQRANQQTDHATTARAVAAADEADREARAAETAARAATEAAAKIRKEADNKRKHAHDLGASPPTPPAAPPKSLHELNQRAFANERKEKEREAKEGVKAVKALEKAFGHDNGSNRLGRRMQKNLRPIRAELLQPKDSKTDKETRA